MLLDLWSLVFLPAEQGMKLFHTGQFPQAGDLAPAQEKFKEQREKGYFNPVVGGVPMIEDKSTPAQKKNGDMPGRPEGSKDKFSRENIQGTIYEVEALNSLAKEKMIESLSSDKKELSESQEKMLAKLCESVICSTKKKNGQKL